MPGPGAGGQPGVMRPAMPNVPQNARMPQGPMQPGGGMGPMMNSQMPNQPQQVRFCLYRMAMFVEEQVFFCKFIPDVATWGLMRLDPAFVDLDSRSSAICITKVLCQYCHICSCPSRIGPKQN